MIGWWVFVGVRLRLNLIFLTYIVVGGDVRVGLHRVGGGCHGAALNQGQGGGQQDLQGERR